MYCADLWELESVLRPCRSQRGQTDFTQTVPKSSYIPFQLCNLRFLQSHALRQEDVLKCPGLSVAPMARHYSATLQNAHGTCSSHCKSSRKCIVRLSGCPFSMSRASRRPMQLSHVKPVSMMIWYVHFSTYISWGFPVFPSAGHPKWVGFGRCQRAWERRKCCESYEGAHLRFHVGRLCVYFWQRLNSWSKTSWEYMISSLKKSIEKHILTSWALCRLCHAPSGG